MRIKEIRAMEGVELSSRLNELKKELMKLNIEASVSNPKNPGKIRQIRKIIARIITVQNNKNKKIKEVDKKA